MVPVIFDDQYTTENAGSPRFGEMSRHNKKASNAGRPAPDFSLEMMVSGFSGCAGQNGRKPSGDREDGLACWA